MRKNIRYICGNASISIFYDTIFCFGRIYSRDWYLAKRNIAVCQIKATAVAAQQQLHLKGCDVVVADFYASESFRQACNELSIHELHAALRCANPAVIRDSRIPKTPSNVVLWNCIREIRREGRETVRLNDSMMSGELYRLHARVSCGQ